jgi:hypothetical protein
MLNRKTERVRSVYGLSRALLSLKLLQGKAGLAVGFSAKQKVQSF